MATGKRLGNKPKKKKKWQHTLLSFVENNRRLFPLSLLFFSSFFCCLIVFRVALGLKKQQALNGVVMSCLGVGRTSTVSRTLTFSCAECLVSSRNCRRDFRHYSITMLQFGVTCLWDQTYSAGLLGGRVTTPLDM